MPNEKPTQTPELVERVFTFGYGHTDPITGASLAEKCVIVRAPSYERCREAMLALYGNKWAFDHATLADTAPRSRPAKMATPIGVLTFGADGITLDRSAVAA